MTSMGPVIFFGGDAKNLPEVAPKIYSSEISFGPALTVCDIPGISFTIVIIKRLMTKPRLRTAWVSGAAPGETAYTAMSAGIFRARAATHHATNNLAGLSHDLFQELRVTLEQVLVEVVVAHLARAEGEGARQSAAGVYSPCERLSIHRRSLPRRR